MTTITIYHNPRCSKSRQTLAWLEQTGEALTIVNYLQQPPTKDTLTQLIKESGESVAHFIRHNEASYQALALSATSSDDALLNAMIAEPKLINRPIVRTPLGTRLCRPPELLMDILTQAQREKIKQAPTEE